MSSRPPSSTIIVDTNIVLSAALGLRTLPVIRSAGRRRRLVTSAEAAVEALNVGQRVAPEVEWAPGNIVAVLDQIEVVEAGRYSDSRAHAESTLRSATASRNGSISDAHILALAWTYDADIWSHDRDFAGTGWPSWSSANLAAALAEEAGVETERS